MVNAGAGVTLSTDYTFDAAERLTAIDDPMDVTKSQMYGYDALNRMTSADVGAWGGPLSYGYDIGGNRTSKTDTASGLGVAYTIASTSNRLTAHAPTVGGVPGVATAQTYDAMGSLVNDGLGMTLGYDVTGRLVQTTRSPSSTTQAYNALGQRVRKTTTGTGAGTTLYAYDEGGRMLGAYRVDSMAPGGFAVNEELVAFDGWRIVATVRPDASLGMSAPVIYPVLSDHLGTPRKVLDPATGFTRWDWDPKEPFGMQAPNENPASAGVFKLDARFPGQRFDAETGLYHNGFRDYHAGLGRYVQSDPLGLEAGWNTYAYVGGAPMGAIDPLGLYSMDDFARDGASVVWSINKALTFDYGFGLFAGVQPDTVCTTSKAYIWTYNTSSAITILAAPYKGAIKGATSRTVGKHSAIKGTVPGMDSHHIIQTAAVTQIPGYSRASAPGILLKGPSTLKGTEHWTATQAQKKLSNGGGTYAAERRIGYRGLREAGISRSDARHAISQADSYFGSLGVTSNTITRIPGNRR